MPRTRLLIGLCLLLLAGATLARDESPPDTTFPPGQPASLVLHGIVNGERTGLWMLVLHDGQGDWYVRELDLRLLGLSVPPGIRWRRHRSEVFLPATKLPYSLYFRPREGVVDIALEESPQRPQHAVAGNRYQLGIVRDRVTTGVVADVVQLGGQWLIHRHAIAALKLEPPETGSVMINGSEYLALADLPFEGFEIDTDWNLLWLETPPSTASKPALTESWVEVNVNASQQPALSLTLMGPRHRFFLTRDALNRFRLRVPDARAVTRDGEQFYPLDAIPGVHQAFDSRQQALMVYAPAAAFIPTQTAVDVRDRPAPDFSDSGVLLNYALFGSSSDLEDRLDGSFEAGAFVGRGFLSSRHLERDIGGTEHESIRLDTTLRLDWPEKMSTLTAGDTLGFSGAWGIPVRFGGLQWGSNFSTQPGFITFPTADIAGAVSVPSTVDIYVNNMLRASQPLPPGPFSVQEVPVVTGAGDVRMVIRDIFGRERVVTEPFYASRQLLRKGLHEFSYEAGNIRENFARESDDYGTGFLALTHRYGLSDRFTGELRGETSSHQTTTGLGVNMLWPAFGEVNVAIAASRDDETGLSGQLGEIGFRRQARQYSLGAQLRATSRDFVQLGMLPGHAPDALQTRAFVSIVPGFGGAITLSHVRRERREDADTEFATLQYSLSLGRFAHLTASLIEPLDDRLERSAVVSISIPLGQRTSTQLSRQYQNGRSTNRAQLQRNLPAGPGFGYRLMAEDGPSKLKQAELALRGAAATLQLQAAEFANSEEYRASLDGGIALMGWRPYLTRRLDRSFALVDAAGIADVDIYRDNQLLTTTGRDGTALVPDLREYESNKIRIGDTKLPLDIQIPELEKTAVPGFRHGVRLRFDLKRSHWISFRLITADEQPVKSGLTLRDIDTGATHITGFDGRVYIDAPLGPHRYSLESGDILCRFGIDIPDDEETVSDLGTVYCGQSTRGDRQP